MMIYLWVLSHWWFEEYRLIVINVQQRHLQRLCGLIRHWLAHVPGHNDKLKEIISSEAEARLDIFSTHCTHR